MKFIELSRFLERIEKTTLRNEIMEILAELFAKSSDEEIDQIVYLSLGRLRPKFDRMEFNLAEKMMIRAVARMAKISNEEVTKVYKEMGDLGEVVKGFRVLKSRIKGSELSVIEVYEKLLEIAKEEGQGSQERKVSKLSKLLLDLDESSAKYVTKVVMGKLRLGFSDKTILDALSFMENGDKSGRKDLDWAYQVSPDVGNIAMLVKKHSISGVVDRVAVTYGVPVIPALAQRLKTADEMIEKMGKVMMEAKFDGTRVQIHYKKNREKSIKNNDLSNGMLFGEKKQDFEVRTFTRNLDENSHMFPELQQISKQIRASEVILDAEAIGYDPKTGELLPFQMTITRKRKHGISDAQKQVPLKFFVFDILYKDGESLIEKPLIERRKILEETIFSGEVLVVDDYKETSDSNELRKYHQKQLDMGLEGAMVKKIDGVYSPGRTGFNWVKFKETEDAVGKLSDTLDVVVMGYYAGKGKRSKFGIGAFLVGVRGEGDKILTLAKVGTGLTDEQWKEMKIRCVEFETEKKPQEYGEIDRTLIPDKWVEARIVVEVAADEITKSPSHSAGMALRFPRLVKFRDDKDVLGITKTEELKTI